MATPEDVLLQFRAGLMKAENNTLKADQRKGLVRLSQAEDGLLHFRWYERVGTSETKGSAQHDTIVFPQEATFTKVASAGASARIYTLDFPQDKTRALFFWMQEPKSDNDSLLTEQVNQVLTANSGHTDEASDMEQDEEAGALGSLLQAASATPAGASPASGGVSAADLAQMLSGFGGGQQSQRPSQGPTQQPSQSQAGPISAADLASVLRNIRVPDGAASGVDNQRGQQAAAAMAQMARASGPSLAEVLKPEVIVPLLQEPGMLEHLAEHLPEEHRNMQGLLAVASSSQWRHQLDIFSHALQTGQLDVSAFGLQFLGFSVADFLESIQKQSDAEAEQRNKTA
ncbi:TPA: hypothetical protein ACH3X2_000421 [Trebouxia sp. C0005]